MKKTFHIGPGWALGFDELQWIPRKAVLSGMKTHWKPVGYIGGRKSLLMRVLRENKAVIDSEGQELLDSLPDTFKEWLKAFKSGQWVSPQVIKEAA